MSNFILLAICLLAGLLLRTSRKLPESAPQALNGFIIHVSLPALVLAQVHGIPRLSWDALLPAGMPWLIFGFGALLMPWLGRRFRWDRRTVGALVLTGGLGNTSFVGFPMLEAIYGPESLRTAVLIDKLGTFLVLSFAGMAAASYYSGAARAQRASTRWAAAIRKVVLFPPFVAVLMAVALKPWDYPQWLSEMLSRLGGTLVPLALVSVGFQLKLDRNLLGRHRRPLFFGLGYKLVLAPALIALVYPWLSAEGWGAGMSRELQITVLEAGMAPMITGSIIASDHGLDPELCSLMVGVGIPLSLLTVPLIAALV